MQKINNSMNLDTTADGMEAYLILSEAGFNDNPISLEEAIRDIEVYIKFGLIKEEVAKLLLNPLFDTRILIARGKAPVQGKDGEIVFHFDTSASSIKPKLLEDGTVDFKNLDNITKIEEGALLAELIDPIDGENGVNVYGKETPFLPGKPKVLKGGKNTRFSDERDKLYAATSGLVRFQDGKVIVENTYKVDSVGVASGNIDFDGSVVVKTDVLTGFILKATGMIEIKGKVEGGEIHSTSDIMVKGGIQGFSKYKVSTTGNLHSKFLENAIVTVGGDIDSEAIMHSDVQSGGVINCTYNKGLIVGGNITAKKEISAKVIGSSMATKTNLDVGLDPYAKDRLIERNAFIKENEPKLKMLISNITAFEQMIAKGQLDSSKKPVYEKLILARDSLMISLEEAKKEVSTLDEELRNVNNGIIRVSDIIYPGVKVSIGDAFLFVRDAMKACTFYKEGPDIRVGSY